MHTTFSLFQVIKPQSKLFLLAQVGLILETLIELLLPLVLATMMDEGVLKGDLSTINMQGAKYIGLFVFSAACVIGFNYCSVKATNNFSSDLRQKSFHYIHALKIAEIQKISTGGLITRLTTDINILQDSLNLIFRFALRAPLMFGGGIVMLLFLDGDFAAILLFTFVIQVSVVWYVLSRTQPLYEKVQKNTDKLNIISQENIAGAKTIKAFVAAEQEEKAFSQINFNVADSLFKVQRLMSLLSPVFMFVMNIALALLLYIGAFSVENNSLQIGEVMAAVSYLTQILFSLMMLAMIFPNMAKARISYRRIKEVFSLDIEKEHHREEGLAPLKGITSIEYKNLSFSYPSAETEDQEHRATLQDLSFSVQEGQRIGILGATGSGKSSLVKLLFRLYEADNGSILINGKPITSYSIDEIRTQITYVLQKSDLFTGSIYHNITFANDPLHKDAIQEDVVHKASTIAQAHGFITKFNNAYDEELGSKGVGVSGGQKQRINLARAFLRKSSVLILDDCTSALDLRTEKEVLSAIKESNMHAMTIFISQKIASVKDLDTIYLLDKGRIVACGRHEELLQSSHLYQEICHSQNIKD